MAVTGWCCAQERRIRTGSGADASVPHPSPSGGEQPDNREHSGQHTVQHLRAGGTIIYRTHPSLFPDWLSHTASGGIRPDGAV